MADPTREKRDLVLAPGTYAYMQDVSKGGIKTYVGPTVITPTAQERPVVYDAKTGDFRSVDNLEDAIRKAPIAVEGFYLILLNPAKNGAHPSEGTSAAADLDVGRRVNIPGPVSFALWPGQAATHVRGHHLRSNQYLLVRVYNENEARNNWHKAVIRTAAPDPNATPEQIAEAAAKQQVVAPPPPQLPVGKLLIIRGDEVSFYIPPTGISVVQDGVDDKGKPKYVRDAMTLERLEYCILVDEDGNKRYEQGPKVVFPEPTERFVEAKDERSGNRTMKFRAIELNEIQGLHIKVIADYEEGGREYKAGEELFITGKDTAIYYPREEHSAIKYDGKSKHFATAIPSGEARYVMNRLTGDIRMVKGPAMLLPDPRTEIIVRRALSDNQVLLWYPGNAEALEYNQSLRTVAAKSPTTRAGAVSEGEIMRSMKGSRTGGGSPIMSYAAAHMEQSMVSGEQNVVGDEFSRASTYTQPRSITLDTKYQGVPTVDIWTGYAVKVVAKTGKRRIESGPTSCQLAYDESLEVVELSTGKPKTTDKLLRTVYLRVENNKVTDIIGAETADHVKVKIYLSYRVNFLPEHKDKWFDVENYVKFLCDHARSVLKSAVRKVKIEDFYGLSTETIRDALLGPSVEGDRPGMFFPENGMHVIDIEVLNVEIGDEAIRGLLEKAQHNVVKSNIDVSDALRGLDVLKKKEAIARETAEENAATQKRKHALEVELAASALAVALSELGTALRKNQERQKVEIEAQKVLDIGAGADLARERATMEQRLTLLSKEQEQKIEFLQAEADAAVKRFGAVADNFSEALLALSNNDTLQKVAEAWSIQRAIGGDSISDALQKVFAGSPLAPLMKKLAPSNGTTTAVADAE